MLYGEASKFATSKGHMLSGSNLIIALDGFICSILLHKYLVLVSYFRSKLSKSSVMLNDSFLCFDHISCPKFISSNPVLK